MVCLLLRERAVPIGYPGITNVPGALVKRWRYCHGRLVIVREWMLAVVTLIPRDYRLRIERLGASGNIHEMQLIPGTDSDFAFGALRIGCKRG
jgi:hypothetical protein